jgi:hypothetical protein
MKSVVGADLRIRPDKGSDSFLTLFDRVAR